MKAVILVPWRPGDPQREANWANVRENLASVGVPIVEGDNTGQQFERARARNVASAKAGEWDVALFCDADVLVPRQNIEAALMRSYLTDAYVVAYSHLRYMTEKGTQERFHGTLSEECEVDEETGYTWECAFAVTRYVFEEVGGFDERFHGYGGQVAAFFYAYATFAGRSRIKGTAFHLHHELVDRTQEPHFDANLKLRARYEAAVDDPTAMRKILAERA